MTESKPVIERIGHLTFKDGVLVSTLDEHGEIAKRGGIDAMLARSLETNAFMRQLAKPK